jgi:hypothetical protein
MQIKSTLFFLASVPAFVSAQITTTQVSPMQTNNTVKPYDSTENFVGDKVNQYIGQELYLMGKSESLRQYGYDGFTKKISENSLNKSNTYKCCDGYNSKYSELAGHYFKVLEVTPHPKASEGSIYEDQYFLKLEDKESHDIVYYKYDTKLKYSFPFVVVGYFEKMKKTSIGKEFVVRGKNWMDGKTMTDISTGNPVSNFEPGNTWKCVDFSIEERYYNLAYILENAAGQRIALTLNSAQSTNWVFSKEDAEKYTRIYGQADFDKILKGSVSVGMTKQECRLSWGDPKSINSLTSASGTTEQWVYDDNYLYFDETGKVTSVQSK